MDRWIDHWNVCPALAYCACRAHAAHSTLLHYTRRPHLPRGEAIHLRRALLRPSPVGSALYVRQRGGALGAEESSLRGCGGAGVQGCRGAGVQGCRGAKLRRRGRAVVQGCGVWQVRRCAGRGGSQVGPGGGAKGWDQGVGPRGGAKVWEPPAAGSTCTSRLRRRRRRSASGASQAAPARASTAR